MVLFRAGNPRACGIAGLDETGAVVEFIEKPMVPKGNFANAGGYVVDAPLYREIAVLGAFDLAQDVIPRFLGRIGRFLFDGYHGDIKTHKTMAAARRDVAAGPFPRTMG